MTRQNPSVGPAAVQLRAAGASLEDVADTLALGNARQALSIIQKELARQGEQNADARDRLRRETNEMLDELIWSTYGKAVDPNDPEHLVAVRAMVTVLDRRAKLNGLDAPTEIALHNPTQTELDRWVAAMVEGAMPAIEDASADDLLGIIDVEVIEESDEPVEAS